MTSQVQKFNSVADYSAELARIESLVNAERDRVKRNAIYKTFEQLETDMIAFRKKKQASHEQDDLIDELNELRDFAKSRGYATLEEMLGKHGLVKTAAAPASASARPKSNPMRGAPKVFTKLLDEKHNGGKVDLKKGHNGSFMGKPQDWHKKIGKKPDDAYFRDATPAETKQMEQNLADWNAKERKARVPKQ